MKSPENVDCFRERCLGISLRANFLKPSSLKHMCFTSPGFMHLLQSTFCSKKNVAIGISRNHCSWTSAEILRRVRASEVLRGIHSLELSALLWVPACFLLDKTCSAFSRSQAYSCRCAAPATSAAPTAPA